MSRGTGSQVESPAATSSVDGRRRLVTAMVVVAAATFGFALVGLRARATYGAQVTADEPYYLLTALSLGAELDLDISDDIAAERFRPFHEANLNEQTIALDAAGQRLSPHDPLLPLLLAGPMRAGGWMAAKAALAAFAAATAAATLWLAVRRCGVPVRIAAPVVGGLFLAPPLTSYATQVYPEMPAALCVTAGLGALTGTAGLRGRTVALVLAAIVALPWLSVKYVPVALVLTTGVLVRGARGSERGGGWRPARPRGSLMRGALRGEPGGRWWLTHRGGSLVVPVAVLVVAGVVYAVVHQRVYGGWTVYAAGDHFVAGELNVVGSNPDYAGRTRRLIGLLVDSQFGLAAWTPAYLLVAPGLVALARRRPPGWPLLVATLATGWANATWVAFTMHGWWWPGRQLVVVLPIAVVAMAVLAQRSPATLGVLLIGCALGIASWAWLAVEASTGQLTLVVDFIDTSNPWYRLWSALLPDQQAFGAGDAVLSWLWAAGLVVAAAAVRRGPAPAPVRLDRSEPARP